MTDERTANWAKTALALLARVNISGAEVDAYMNVRNGLQLMAEGKLIVVPPIQVPPPEPNKPEPPADPEQPGDQPH